MSERLIVERGIGEDRFAHTKGDAIVEAWVERAGTLLHGHVYQGRLTRKLGSRGEGDIDGQTILIDPWPAGLTEGATTPLQIIREAIPERGRDRSAKARPVTPGCTDSPKEATDALPLVPRMPGTSELDIVGWTELIEEAGTGIVAFDGGLLAIVPTPAGITIDVDGALPIGELARRGAIAAALAIRRLGLAGSILIDLPSLDGKAQRQAVADTFDAHLPKPFERTGINGFGLLQVIRPRVRASLLEQLQNRPVESAALNLLRRAEHAGATRTLDLRAGASVAGWLTERPELLQQLKERTGVAPTLKPHGKDPLWWGDVHSQ
ncbi:ribonuclease [Pacificimonas sp. ICDLI1SI03]